jgi:hypothetical protein
MKTITTSTEFKEAISLLEIEQELKGYALKDQFNRAYDSLKPVSIFKSLAKGAITSPNIIGNVLSTSIGLATGFYTNKLIVGASTGILRKLMGSAIQTGITAIIARHPEALTSVGKVLSRFASPRKREPVTTKT